MVRSTLPYLHHWTGLRLILGVPALAHDSRMRMRGLLTLTRKAMAMAVFRGRAQECSLTLAGAPTDQNRFLLNFLKTPARRRLLHSCKSTKSQYVQRKLFPGTRRRLLSLAEDACSQLGDTPAPNVQNFAFF